VCSGRIVLTIKNAMYFFLNLFFCISTVSAAEIEWLNLPTAVPVFAKPAEGASLLVMTKEGERIGVRRRGKTYTRVQVQRAGKWKVGYVFNTDLESTEAIASRGEFGFGAGGLYSYLRHGGKDFETNDQVQYSTEDFASSSFSPSLMVQFGQDDFWRFVFNYRLTAYTSSAKNDLPGASVRSLSLDHTMYSVILQKMWTPLSKPVFYYGFGLEASKAGDAQLVLGGINLPVSAKDLPTYLGGHAALGGQIDFGRSFSAFSEFRLGAFVNQSPFILSAEIAVGILFWP
jgi:hypothetical protein